MTGIDVGALTEGLLEVFDLPENGYWVTRGYFSEADARRAVTFVAARVEQAVRQQIANDLTDQAKAFDNMRVRAAYRDAARLARGGSDD